MIRTAIRLAAVLAAVAGPALAAERSVGTPVAVDGLEIGAVYLQGVVMDPTDALCGPADGDIHLEADVHALKGNPNGFRAGEWVPYLTVSYVLTKTGGTYASSGPLVPMVADDGPHYGRNVKLDGAGKYHLAVTVAPPAGAVFYRHVDAETGVGPWWSPITEQWDFVFVGSAGKKGGY